VERYAAFMEKLTDMVVGKYRGSLKAEHGTGRNMAPFVEKEWGERAYGMMTRIKALFDPRGILNPDVILSADKRIHLKHLKPLPLTDAKVDKCIECGFCEDVCPSRNATLTPRQRIVVRREISRLRETGGGRRRMRALTRGFAYRGEQTCATDGMCASKCPVGIDTGALIKSLRGESKTAWQRAAAKVVAGRFAAVLGGMRLGLRLLQSARGLLGRDALGHDRVSTILDTAARTVPGIIPKGLRYLPRPGRSPSVTPLRKLSIPPSAAPVAPSFSSPPIPGDAPRVLYFPSLRQPRFRPRKIRRSSFARNHDGPVASGRLRRKRPFRHRRIVLRPGLRFQRLRRSGECEVAGSPCGPGTAWAGMRGHRMRHQPVHPAAIGKNRAMARRPRLGGLSGEPGPAAPGDFKAQTLRGHPLRMQHLENGHGREPGGPGRRLRGQSDRAGRHRLLRRGRRPDVPPSGAAPVRLRLLAERAPGRLPGGYSSSRTCEIGLTQAAGIPYRSILYLLYEATAPASAEAAALARTGKPEGEPRPSHPKP